jgi:hypothetical protein
LLVGKVFFYQKKKKVGRSRDKPGFRFNDPKIELFDCSEKKKKNKSDQEAYSKSCHNLKSCIT